MGDRHARLLGSRSTARYANDRKCAPGCPPFVGAGYDLNVGSRDTAGPLIDASMSDALAELEDYLAGLPEEHAAELVLPFGSRWVLPEAGFDLGRLRDEAETMMKATPLSDRIVSGYADHLAYWVSQRMLLDEHDQPRTDSAAQLEAARATLRERAALVDAEGFPRVAIGLRRALDESSGGVPPDDRLWAAMALRIAESVLP
jgi:hypothetical protein